MTRATDGKGGRELNGKLSSSYTYQTVNSSSQLLFMQFFCFFFFSISLRRIIHSFNYAQFRRNNFETENKDTGVLCSVRTTSLIPTSFTRTLKVQLWQFSSLGTASFRVWLSKVQTWIRGDHLFKKKIYNLPRWSIPLSSSSDVLSQPET